MFDSVRKRAATAPGDSAQLRCLLASCHKLLTEPGGAAGASLARATLDLYAALDRKDEARFFEALRADFSPDPAQVLAAAQAYAAEASAASLARLGVAADPPRQELLRRLNRAPGGTAAILRMRERLLTLQADTPELEAVDGDFRHLLASWFNPGFLQIVRVDWRTPAYLLEQIIAHEAVHEIRDWSDLRRRLDADGRCYAFFHPALPDEPLIFVEIALTKRMAAAVAPLLDARAAPIDPARATTAVFYSISNCQPGLRGVSLGNFLIKNVVDVLARELPRLEVFCTLSPVPGFVAWLESRLRGGDGRQPRVMAEALRTVTATLGTDVGKFLANPTNAVDRLAPLQLPLLRLCATYLQQIAERGEPIRDPVARFHLNNGARLERINWLADTSRKRLRQSLGLMVNYLYESSAIEANHERFMAGEVVASRRARSLIIPSA